MAFSTPFEGFRLAYDRAGSGSPVVLLHGWPGDRTDYDRLVPLLTGHADVIAPDLRGFGESDKHHVDVEQHYSGLGQANAVIALADELGIKNAVFVGYDVGSFVAQTVAQRRPDLVKALVVAPPLPGGGARVLELRSVREFWYSSLHQLGLVEEIVDGNPAAVRAYLRHFWNHWSGPDYTVDDARLDHLTSVYSPPGAFTAALLWYRTSSDPVAAYAAEKVPPRAQRLTTPTTVLWQEHDPIFPLAWADRLDDFFTDYTYEQLSGVGHFTPLEATDAVAEAIKKRLGG